MPSFELTFSVRKKDAAGNLLSTHVVTNQKQTVTASDGTMARRMLNSQYNGAAVITNTKPLY